MAKGPKGYLEQSRDLLNSLVLVLPLMLLYQLGLFVTDWEVRNGADFVTPLLYRYWGSTGLLVFNGVLLAAGVIGILVLKNKSRLSPDIFVPMLIESTVYALLLGTIVIFVIKHIPGMVVQPCAVGGFGAVSGFFVSVGAGVNEELFFRLGLYSLLLYGFSKVFEGEGMAIGWAIFVSSVLFSLAHYLGPEDFAVYTFVYRTLAGGLFCAIFLLRGFAIAAYTHAIYDIYVIVLS